MANETSPPTTKTAPHGVGQDRVSTDSTGKTTRMIAKAVIRDVSGGESRIWIQQRGKRKLFPYMGELPGGHVKDGETPRDGVLREIREELQANLTQDNALVAHIAESVKVSYKGPDGAENVSDCSVWEVVPKDKVELNVDKEEVVLGGWVPETDVRNAANSGNALVRISGHGVQLNPVAVEQLRTYFAKREEQLRVRDQLGDEP